MNSSKFFLSTLIAAAAMTAPVYAENGDTVKINFNANEGKSTDEGWTDTVVNSNSNRELSDSAGSTVYANWSATGMWRVGNSEMGILNGYLDDNNNGTNVEILVGVTGISYLCYDVTIYCAADIAGSFSAKTVNGVTYTYDSEAKRTVIGETSWGAGSAAGTTPIEGENCLTVSLLAGDLSISSLGDNVGQNATGKARGNIAAIEIVDTSVAYGFALSGSSLGWSSSSLGGSEWKNASALNGGSYANFSIEGDTVINVSETIDTVAIFTTGTGKLTLAGESPINMVAASKIGAGSGTSIEIQNAVNFSNGGTISGAVSTSGSGVVNVAGGTLVVTDALSAGDVAPTVSVSLSNDSAVSFDISNAGTNANLSKISGGADTRIKLKASGNADAFSTITSLGADFGGSVEVTGGYLRLDSEGLVSALSPASSLVLSGGNESGLVFLRAKNLVFGKDIVAEGNGGALRSYASNEYSVEFTGSVTGTSITHTDGGTHTFSGSVDLDTFNANAGVTTFNGAETTIGTLLLTNGATTEIAVGNTNVVNIQKLGVHAAGTSTTETLNVTSGLVNITKEHKDIANLSESQAAVILGHWHYGKGILNLTGGTVNVKDGWTILSWDSAAELNIKGGTYNAYGITFNTARSADNATIDLASGRLNVGVGGIVKGAVSEGVSKTFNISGGTLGVFGGDWSSEMDITLAGNGTVDTLDADDETGRTITLNGLISGAGSLTKIGAGTLALSGSNSYSGETTISSGKLVAANANALGTSSVTISGGQLEVSGTDVTVSNNITVVLGDTLENPVILGDGSLGGKITLNYAASAENAALMIATETTTKTYTLLSGNVGANLTEANFEVGTGWADGWSISDYAYNSETGIGTLTMTIPEPSAFGLLAGVGALALVVSRRKRRK